MRIVGAVRLDDLFERAGAAGNPNAEAITDHSQLAHRRVGVPAFAAMKKPAALCQRAERLSRIEDGDVACGHLALLSFEADAKPSRALLEGAFAAFEDIADMLAHIRVFEATRQIADGGQLAGRMSAGKRDDDWTSPLSVES